MADLVWEQSRVDAWCEVDGNNTLRLDHDLDENSTVFDIGAYIGDTSARLFDKYGCTIHAFEPIPRYHSILHERFDDNPKIHTHPFGLTDVTNLFFMIEDDYASSMYRGGETLTVAVDIEQFMEMCQIDRVHLAEINVEGAEYPLLNHMIGRNLITKFDNLQIQFHDVLEDNGTYMQWLWEKLSKTHELTYQYIYCFENWKLKNA